MLTVTLTSTSMSDVDSARFSFCFILHIEYATPSGHSFIVFCTIRRPIWAKINHVHSNIA